MNKTLIKLERAYMEEPLLMKVDKIYRHVNTQDLDVSPDLKRSLAVWDKDYQDTFNADYPPDSGFPTLQADEAHKQEGRRLAHALQKELGDGFIVDYRG